MTKHHWHILGSLPSDDPRYRNHREDRQCHVIASTITRAIELVLQKYPNLIVHSAAQHHAAQRHLAIEIVEEPGLGASK